MFHFKNSNNSFVIDLSFVMYNCKYIFVTLKFSNGFSSILSKYSKCIVLSVSPNR